MRTKHVVRIATGSVVALGLILLAGTWRSSPRVQAQDDPGNESSLIQIGFDVAPVHLNLNGKNKALVGLGSFLVNAGGDCNGCHNGGGPPNFNYARGGNPYFGQPAKVDPTTYLEGGADFGPAVPPIPGVYPPPEFGSYVGPDIITRNLTPDKTGRPEGGHTLAEFKQIMRTGIDMDHLHPTCTTAVPTPMPANCIPPPVDGSLLQIMPWPAFHHMTDRQLEAIYEYLSAIPCLEGSPDPTSNLHNDCGTQAHQSGAPDAGRKKAGSHHGF
jgi:hypothetical protein